MDHSSIYKKLDKLFEAFTDVKPEELAAPVAKSELTQKIASSFMNNPFVRKHGWGRKPHKELGKKINNSVALKMKKYKEAIVASNGNLDPESQEFYELFKRLNQKNPLAAIDNIVLAITKGLANAQTKAGVDPDKNAEIRMREILSITSATGYSDDDVAIIIEAFEDADISKFLATAQTVRNTAAQNIPGKGTP